MRYKYNYVNMIPSKTTTYSKLSKERSKAIDTIDKHYNQAQNKA